MAWLPKLLCCGVYMQAKLNEDAMYCIHCGRVVTGLDVLEGVVKLPPEEEETEEVA